MNGYIGYIRVSTAKQGEGVSLPVQKEAISHYGERNRYPIGLWLEEMETAAKRGRPVFNQALRLLRQGKYRGIILHKLDRGARNLKDWAEIGELSDRGIEVHFVTESLDLQSRGGRLSADIQAVVAADYIRNLREETRKGFYGRLKQGIYPLQAPIGYLDQGSGNAKVIDPIKGPLVRRAFEFYATGRYSLKTLGHELNRLGLRNHNGGRVMLSSLSAMLNNPFYMGIIRLRKTDESFPGIHAPLIGKRLFDRVQKVLTGKVSARTQRHSFQFRRMLSCARCKYSLIGESQKSIVYYRCHSPQCRGTVVRQDRMNAAISRLLDCLVFSEQEQAYFRARILTIKKEWATRQNDELKSVRLTLEQLANRLNRLTDAFLDRVLDQALFEQRKAALLHEQKTMEERLAALTANSAEMPDRLGKFLELAGNASLSHGLANDEEKREMVNILTSNRTVTGKNVEIEPSFPFQELVNRSKTATCPLERDMPRTWDPILENLAALNTQGLLPDLETIPGFCRIKDTPSTGMVEALDFAGSGNPIGPYSNN